LQQGIFEVGKAMVKELEGGGGVACCVGRIFDASHDEVEFILPAVLGCRNQLEGEESLLLI
jgi:hypothetical protein